MGQKVHPTGIRLGIVRDWASRWYANKRDYPKMLNEDIAIRRHVEKKLAKALVSHILIKRTAGDAKIEIYAARPGVVIGKRGGDVEKLRAEVSRMIGVPVHIDIKEVRKPELNARLVAINIAQQLERRVMFRRAMKRAVSTAMRLGAEGIKINVAGRLGGAEIARTEWYLEGRVPLHTFRADIDYGVARAQTTYGVIGVKVWIFKGEILKPSHKQEQQSSASQPTETAA